ncbi:MAG: 3-oxosteroid 1-dehydrogenase [Myxococcales bacterium]|nr:3-oxosteroid 1-dehydrogenase [Myxococcales bacterium]
MKPWDHEFDLLVVGSGAAALSTALRAHDLGARVLLVEKSSHWGGSTAMSGGVCWVPNHPWMDSVGIEDSREEALTYLGHVTAGEVEPARLEAYVDGAHRLLRWASETSHLAFDPIPAYCDYYPEAPGGKPGGRSMDSRPFDGARLGHALETLRRPHPQSQILGLFGITAAQAQTLLAGSLLARMWLMLRCFVGYFLRGLKRRRFGRDTRLTTGNALCARLRRSLMDRGVELWLESPCRELVTEDGRVMGIVVQKGETSLRLRGRWGVMLAAGGFERSQVLRDRFHPFESQTDWNAGNEANEGDGILMGEVAGGDLRLMDQLWWTPVSQVPRSEFAWVLVVEKNLPGSIFVNAQGQRFMNEAEPYLDAGRHMLSQGPCWLLFDARYRHLYPCGPVAPGYAMPDKRVPRRLREGYLKTAATVRELAGVIQVDPAVLEATLAEFNQAASAGHDGAFGRGESASDRYYGDPRVQPNPCLAALDKPPFYAVPIYPGDLGTKGGLATDVKGRVIDGEGRAISGLYAAGNNSASVMGPSYPGAGGTIGPALTFGFLAAEAAKEDAGD